MSNEIYSKLQEDCQSDCYWNFNGSCVSDELDDKDIVEKMTLDNNCPSYLHPDLEETMEMRSFIRKNIAKVDKHDVETVYTLLRGLNERRIHNSNEKINSNISE